VSVATQKSIAGKGDTPGEQAQVRQTGISNWRRQST